MRTKAVQIHWHNKQPIYSADFHPRDPFKLATCGGDNNIRLWRLKRENINGGTTMTGKTEQNEVHIEYLATLTKHMKSVNCVRFSPCGEFLASAGDGGIVLLWKQSETAPLQFNKAFGEDSDDEDDDSDRKEYWSVFNQFRVMEGEDVYDLAWSPEGKYLIIGLTDNSAQIWDTQQGGRCVKVLKDHQHFVQGVAWDPLDQLLVTQSSDRSVKIWTMRRRQSGNPISTSFSSSNSNITNSSSINTTTTTNNSISNNNITFIALTKYTKICPNSDESTPSTMVSTVPAAYSMFHDETLVSFFRRPTFSPDGSILVLPAGIKSPLTTTTTTSSSTTTSHSHGIYLNMRNNLHRTPTAFFGGFEKAAVAIRFNPKFYPLLKSTHGSNEADTVVMCDNNTDDIQAPWLSLPYRMIFSVITQNAIYIFDTQRTTAIFMFSNLHYASLTDATWSCDGRSLIVSSVDGFCTVADFEYVSDFGSEPFETDPSFKTEMTQMIKSSIFHNPPAKVKKSVNANSVLKEGINNDTEIDLEDVGVDAVIDENDENENLVENVSAVIDFSTSTMINNASGNGNKNNENINILPVKAKKRIAPTLISNEFTV